MFYRSAESLFGIELDVGFYEIERRDLIRIIIIHESYFCQEFLCKLASTRVVVKMTHRPNIKNPIFLNLGHIIDP